ncbi:MAG: AAA family ATPase, partial [Bacteroidales bacterium]
SICDAIIADCSTESPRRTLEAKARQVERILKNSSRSGFSHVLMIEEAHDLTIPTLKYLKRFWELEDGFKKLLAIVLIGQIEMKPKLQVEQNWDAREVLRRMEVFEIPSFKDGSEIARYLDVKFARIGKERKTIIDDSGCNALGEHLRRQTQRGGIYSVAFPLTVNNLCKSALNLAAELDADVVSADIVRSL